MYRYIYIYIYIEREREQWWFRRGLLWEAAGHEPDWSHALRQRLSGGTTCITLLVQHMVSSKVANNAAT